MLKKIIVCLTASALMSVTNALAVDMDSVIYDHTVCSFVDGVSYVTPEGKLCVKYIEETTYNSGEYDVTMQDLYFDDVKSLSFQFERWQYMAHQAVKLEMPYYIKKDGTVWRYTIDENGVQTQQIKGVSNALKVYSIEYLGFALEKNGTLKYWNQVDPEPVVYEFDGLSNIVDISVSTYFTAYEAAKNDISESNFPYYVLAVDSSGKAYEILFRMKCYEDWYIAGEYLYERPEKIEIEIIPEIVSIDIDEKCAQSVSDGSHKNYIRTADGHLYVYDIYKRELEKIEGIDNAAYISIEGSGFTPVVYTDDNKILMLEKVGDGLLIPYNKFYNVTEYGAPSYISAGYKMYYVYDDGTMVLGEGVRHYYNDTAVQIVDEDDPNKVKISRIELMRRERLANKIIEFYEEQAGETEAGASAGVFCDITDSEYKEDIEKCAELGIINGVSKTEFSPDGILTREQLAVILKRMMEQLGIRNDFSGTETEYSDTEKVSSWAKDSIGIIESCFEVTNKRLAPDEYVTVEEFEDILQNLQAEYLNK